MPVCIGIINAVCVVCAVPTAVDNTISCIGVSPTDENLFVSGDLDGKTCI